MHTWSPPATADNQGSGQLPNFSFYPFLSEHNSLRLKQPEFNRILTEDSSRWKISSKLKIHLSPKLTVNVSLQEHGQLGNRRCSGNALGRMLHNRVVAGPPQVTPETSAVLRWEGRGLDVETYMFNTCHPQVPKRGPRLQGHGCRPSQVPITHVSRAGKATFLVPATTRVLGTQDAINIC